MAMRVYVIINMFELTRFSTNRTYKEAAEIYAQRLIDAKIIFEKHHQNFSYRSCPVCGSSDVYHLDPFHETYGVDRCCVCQTAFVNPAPNAEALKDYYNNAPSNLMLDQRYRARSKEKKTFILDDRVDVVLELLHTFDSKKTVRILEVGCGSGGFLSRLSSVLSAGTYGQKVNLSGIDIDENAILACVDKRLQLTCCSAEAYVKRQSSQYDIVLHFELIEHLVDPYAFIRDVRKLLKPGGFTVFTTPNASGLELVSSGYNKFRLLAHGIFPPMHLNAFSAYNMTHFAIRSGFHLFRIRTPGKLDVDMISLTRDERDDAGVRAIAPLDYHAKGIIQYLISYLNASSHMECIFRRN